MGQKNKLYTTLVLSLLVLGGAVMGLSFLNLGKFTVVTQFFQSVIIILFWSIFYLLLKFAVFDSYREKSHMEFPRIFVSMLRFLFIFFAILSITVIVFDQSLLSVAALGGLIGAGITYAISEIILDTFSGVILEVEGPLEVNDWIKVDDDREGMIISVNWRTVILKTLNETLIVVPHRDLSKGYTNYSRPTRPYWDNVEIGLDHTLPVERAERILRAAIMKTPSIYDHQCDAAAVKITESGINYDLKYMVPDFATGRRVRHDVIQSVTNHLHSCNLRVSESLGEYGIFKGEKPFKEEPVIGVGMLVDKVELLRNLTDVVSAKISEGARCHSFVEGDVIVREGDEGNSLFLIAEGVVSISITYVSESGESREKHLFNMGFPDCFGEMSLFLHDARSATVRAATNCLIYEVSHDLIKESLKGSPEIFDKMVEDARAKKERNIKLKEEMSRLKEHEHDEVKGVFAHLKDLFR